MTEKEAEQLYDSYVDWKSEKMKPFLDKREKAFQKLQDAQQKYFAAVDALNRHEANSMFFEQIARNCDKARARSIMAQSEYNEALDKFSLSAYLKEQRTRK